MRFEHGVPIALWEGPAPGSESWTHEERLDSMSFLSGGRPILRNVVHPTITPYLPDGATDRAVIVAPGGALHFLAIESEGSAVAELVRAVGSAAFVLTYRVVPTPPDDEGFGNALRTAFVDGMDETTATALSLAVADAVRALELVRSAGFTHVTLVGFSSGARVTAEVIVRGEPAQQPDAAAAVYLPDLEECSVDASAPPLFVLAAADDPLGSDGSLALHHAWRAAGVPVELHLFERGGHGFGTNPTGLPVDRWPELFLAWLATQQA
jgi:acetyl esterase/lipase